MGWLYWLTGVVADSKTASSTKEWEHLAGAGLKVQNRFLFWDTDLGWSESFRANLWQGGRPYLRSTVGLQSGWAGVEAGVIATPDTQGTSLSIGPFDLTVSTRWYAGLRFF